jgi:acetyl-CoA acetyltransferase
VPEVFICDHIRTPIGRFSGSLSSVRAAGSAVHWCDKEELKHLRSTREEGLVA